jgi:hypothetical protein
MGYWLHGFLRFRRNQSDHLGLRDLERLPRLLHRSWSAALSGQLSKFGEVSVWQSRRWQKLIGESADEEERRWDLVLGVQGRDPSPSHLRRDWERSVGDIGGTWTCCIDSGGLEMMIDVFDASAQWIMTGSSVGGEVVCSQLCAHTLDTTGLRYRCGNV